MERKNEGEGREYPISKADSPRVSPVALVVDDDMTVRLLARQALEEIGLLVEETADGASGLSAYERLNPDIVLLDIVMPKLDGFHVCKALRNLPGGGATPVIMMTGQDDLESIDRYRSKVLARYISIEKNTVSLYGGVIAKPSRAKGERPWWNKKYISHFAFVLQLER